MQVADGSETWQRKITLGLVNDEYAEVTEGLSEGEQVVVIARNSTDIFTTMMQQGEAMRQSAGR